MENVLVVAATAGGTIELFQRKGLGGTQLVLLGRWERRKGRASWGLAATLVSLLQSLVQTLSDEDYSEGTLVRLSVRAVDRGLNAVGFDRTYNSCTTRPEE